MRSVTQADEAEATTVVPRKPAMAARVAVAVTAKAADVNANNIDNANDTDHPAKSGRPMRCFEDRLWTELRPCGRQPLECALCGWDRFRQVRIAW